MTWYPQTYVEEIPMSSMNMRPDEANGYPGRTYRFYAGETVYAFADGISYTQFDHQLIKAPRVVSLRLDESHTCRSSKCQSLETIGTHCKNAVRGGSDIEVQLKVKNVGDREGTQTVFLFTTPPAIHRSPIKQLIRFEKVHLGKNEETVVRFKINVCKDLSVVDEMGKRKIALGHHLLHLGSLKHSLNIRV